MRRDAPHGQSADLQSVRPAHRSLSADEMMKFAVFPKQQCLLATAPWLFLAACAQRQPADVAIRGVTIVDVTDGSLLSDQTVLIQGSRIVAVGPVAEVAVSDNADVVDAH